MVEDENVKSLMFLLIVADAPFTLDELIGPFFGREDKRLAAFLDRLDDAGLEIRKKQ